MALSLRALPRRLNNNKFAVGATLATLFCSALLLLSLSGVPWDITRYDHNRIMLQITRDRLTKAESPSASWLDVIDGSGSQPLAVLWQMAPAGSSACGTRNATIITNEESTPFHVCRQYDRARLVNAMAQSACTQYGQQHLAMCVGCIDYYEEYKRNGPAPDAHSRAFDGYCCSGCCAFAARARYHMAHESRTLHESINTIISCLVVAVLLQLATYVQLFITALTGLVMLCFMSGVACGISGLYLAFALLVNVYKMKLITSHNRSLGHMPYQATVAADATPAVGFYLAWASAVGNIALAVVWICQSKRMADAELKRRHDDSYRINRKNSQLHMHLPKRFTDKIEKLGGIRHRLPSPGQTNRVAPEQLAITPHICVDQ